MIKKIINRLKARLVNWLVKDIIIEGITTKRLIDKGNTLYVDVADFDHNTSDGTPTESQMWYNSTDHVMRYRNDSETIDIGGGSTSPTFESYWNGQLVAGGGSYTPAANGLYGGASETYPSYYDVQIWVYGTSTWGCVGADAIKPSFGDYPSGHYLRIYNSDASNAYYAVLFRTDVMASEPTIERFTAGYLGSGSYYTPSVNGLWRFSIWKTTTAVGTSMNGAYARVQLHDGTAWRWQGDEDNYWAVGVATDTRLGNGYSSGVNYALHRWS